MGLSPYTIELSCVVWPIYQLEYYTGSSSSSSLGGISDSASLAFTMFFILNSMAACEIEVSLLLS